MTDNSVEAYLCFGPSILPQTSSIVNCYFMGKKNDNITVSFHELAKENHFAPQLSFKLQHHK